MKILPVLFTLILISMTISHSSSLAETIHTKLQGNVNKVAYKISGPEADSIGFTRKNFDMGWWKVANGDTILEIDDESMRGLIKGDFSLFYHREAIGQLSPLKRTSDIYIEAYKEHKKLMDSLRKNLVENGVMVSSTGNEWSIPLEYDLDKKCFLIDLSPSGYHKPLSQSMLDSEYDMAKRDGIIFNNLRIHPFIPIELFKCFTIRKSQHPLGVTIEQSTWDLIVPISNEKVALAIEESSGTSGLLPHARDFAFYCKSKVKFPDDLDLSHLEAEDILLIYIPTGQVVWSATTGDHSEEVTL